MEFPVPKQIGRKEAAIAEMSGRKKADVLPCDGKYRTPVGTAVGTTLSEQGPVGLSSPLSLGRERLCPTQRGMVCTSNLPAPLRTRKRKRSAGAGIHRLVAGRTCARWSRPPAPLWPGGPKPARCGAGCPSPASERKGSRDPGQADAGLDIGQA